MHKRFHVICFFVFLLSNVVVFVASGGKLEIEKTLTQADGLASNRVFSILADSHGVLWFGTTEGVTRYDGERLETFTTEEGLVSNTIRLIFEDSQGRIWFGKGGPWPTHSSGESNGVSYYDGQAFGIFSTEDGLTSNNVTDIFEDNTGDLWFATMDFNNGVSRFDGETFVDPFIVEGPIGMFVLPEWWNDVMVIAQDSAGNFWFGSVAGLSYYNVQTSQTRYFSVDDAFKPFVEMGQASSGHVNALVFDEHKHLWIGTNGEYEQDSGLRRYDGTQFVNFSTSKELPMNNIRRILRDSKGNLWLVGEKMSPPRLDVGVGISVYSGKTFENFNTDDGLPHASVRSVTEDRSGKLWFATDAGVSVGVYVPSAD